MSEKRSKSITEHWKSLPAAKKARALGAGVVLAGGAYMFTGDQTPSVDSPPIRDALLGKDLAGLPDKVPIPLPGPTSDMGVGGVEAPEPGPSTPTTWIAPKKTTSTSMPDRKDEYSYPGQFPDPNNPEPHSGMHQDPVAELHRHEQSSEQNRPSS